MNRSRVSGANCVLHQMVNAVTATEGRADHDQDGTLGLGPSRVRRDRLVGDDTDPPKRV